MVKVTSRESDCDRFKILLAFHSALKNERDTKLIYFSASQNVLNTLQEGRTEE